MPLPQGRSEWIAFLIEIAFASHAEFVNAFETVFCVFIDCVQVNQCRVVEKHRDSIL